MKDVKALRVHVKRESYYSIEISAELGYDDFPDTALEFVDYVNTLRGDITPILEDAIDDLPCMFEDTIVDIEEVN